MIFSQEIPWELEESAKLDGATPFQTLRKVIFPLAAPGVFSTGILVFIAAWNEYLFALTINTERIHGAPYQLEFPSIKVDLRFLGKISQLPLSL